MSCGTLMSRTRSVMAMAKTPSLNASVRAVSRWLAIRSPPWAEWRPSYPATPARSPPIWGGRLVGYGLLDEILEVANDFLIRPLPPTHADQLLLGIDEEMGALSPRPAVRPVGQHRAARRVIGHHAHAQPITLAGGTARQCVGNVHGAPHLDRLAAEQPRAVHLAAIRQHDPQRNVIRGGAVEATPSPELHIPHNRCIGTLLLRQTFCAPRVDGRHSRPLCLGRPERDVLHTQWIENAGPKETIEGTSRNV